MDSIAAQQQQSLDNLVSASLSGLVVLLSLYLYFAHSNRKSSSYFKQFNLQTPPTVPMLGNLHAFLLHNPTSQRVEWAKTYGKVYGFFWSSEARFVVGDAAILSDISVRHFDTFANHKLSLFSNKYQDKFLTHLKDAHWRRVRSLMTPTFTSAKIRAMFSLLDACSNDLVANCAQLANCPKNVINAKELFNLYTMDAITSCCYGIKLGKRRQLDDDSSSLGASDHDDFVNDAMLIMQLSKWRILVATFCPDWLVKLTGFQIYPDKLYDPIAAKTAKIIKSRRSSPIKINDYLQSLLDATIDIRSQDYEQDSGNASKIQQIDGKVDSQQSLSLTDDEILCNSILFLVVGMETTANLLASSLYCLAFHQEIQQRLYEEITSIVVISNGEHQFDYDTLSAARYLDAFVSETLRYIPPVGSFDRVSCEDYHNEKLRVTIPSGSVVDLAYDSIMKNPDYWPEPEQFKPERFLPDNKSEIVPGAFCPFGLGPRHCLGKRFALTEAKLALAKLLMKYSFEPAPGTRFPPELDGHISLTWIKDPSVCVVPRTTSSVANE